MGRIDLGKRLSLICAATVVAGNFAFADAGKNCITDVKLNKDGGSVRVNIYTNKPYTDSVVVSKKEGNKYVILVPETTSSVKTAPKVIGGGNVSVSMQTINAGKGYTKITIVSDKSINVLPKTITSSTSVKTVSKPAQTTSKPAQTVSKTNQSTTKKATQSAKTVQKQTQKTVAKQAHTKNVTPVKKQKSAKKVVQVKKQTPVTKSVVPVKPVTSKPVVAQQSVPKPVQKPVSVNNNVNKPIEILEHEVNTGKVNDVQETKQDALLEQAIKDNDAIINERNAKKLKNKNNTTTDDSKLGAKACIKLVLDELQELSLWKLLLLAGAVTFPIIVIMIILNLDKKVNKKIKAIRKEEDDVVAMERALRENVAAVRAQKAAQAVPEQSFNSIDEMLDKVEETPDITDSYNTSSSYESQTSVSENEYQAEPLNSSNDDDLNVVDSSDFELDDENGDNELEKNSVIPEVVSDEEFSNIIDNEDDSTSLDDFVADSTNISVDNSELEQTTTEVAPYKSDVPYNPDGVLADFSNVNDKEFFDELVLQSFAQKGTDNLPENSPADDVFGVMTENETGLMLSDFEHDNFENPEDVSNGLVTQSHDEVTMLNEVKINDNAGLYLVNYDNSSSLVGHIADDYFVLKQFDRLEKGKIILKHAEKVEDANRYLVRVGRNKMIVEVSDKSMSRLIDL